MNHLRFLPLFSRFFSCNVLFTLGILLSLDCEAGLLKARREYLSPEFLASERVDTPDPRRLLFVGEELLLFWKLPALRGNLHLSLLFQNCEREEMTFSIAGRAGVSRYRLLNDAFTLKGGIVAFKAELLQDGQVLETYQDPLWAEPIACE